MDLIDKYRDAMSIELGQKQGMAAQHETLTLLQDELRRLFERYIGSSIDDHNRAALTAHVSTILSRYENEGRIRLYNVVSDHDFITVRFWFHGMNNAYAMKIGMEM